MRIKLSWRWYEIGLVVLCVGLYAFVAIGPFNSMMKWFRSDDAFYYFKVAENIANGHGATFDGISLTNGFHPLWMLICIPIFSLTRINLILPLRILIIVSALLNAGTGILLFRLLRRFISAEVAALAGIMWVFLPGIQVPVVQNGMESNISAFCLVLLLSLVIRFQQESFSKKNLFWVGVAAGLTLLARLDNIFVVMLIGAWFTLGFTTSYLRAVIVGDLTLIFIVGLLSYYVRLPVGATYLAVSTPWLLALEFILTPLFLFLFGFYSQVPETINWKFISRITVAVLCSSVITGASLLLLQKLGVYSALSRSIIFIDFAGTLGFTIGLRWLAGRIFPSNASANSIPVRTWQFWKPALPHFLGYFVPLLVMEGVYMGWSYLYTGTPLPVSGQIKQWWGTLPFTYYGSLDHTTARLFGEEAWGILLSIPQVVTGWVGTYLNPKAAGAIGNITGWLLALVILVFLGKQGKWSVPVIEKLGLFVLFGAVFAHIFSYTSTSYLETRTWYWVSEALFSVIILSVVFECIYLSFPGWKINPMVGKIFLAISCLVILFQSFIFNFGFFRHADPKDSELPLINFIEANTEPGALIGMTGGGTIGYFMSTRTIVNLDGLISSPEYFHLMKTGKASTFLDRAGMGYAFGIANMLTDSDPYSQFLAARLKPIAMIGNYTLFRYNRTP